MDALGLLRVPESGLHRALSGQRASRSPRFAPLVLFLSSGVYLFIAIRAPLSGDIFRQLLTAFFCLVRGGSFAERGLSFRRDSRPSPSVVVKVELPPPPEGNHPSVPCATPLGQPALSGRRICDKQLYLSLPLSRGGFCFRRGSFFLSAFETPASDLASTRMESDDIDAINISPPPPV